MAHVFISYAPTDEEVAETICRYLEKNGIKCWITLPTLGGYERIDECIIEAIKTAAYVVLVFSSQADSSEKVLKEILAATRYKIKVFPIRIENVRPSDILEYLLAPYHWFDVFESPLENFLPILLKAITSHVPDLKVKPPFPKPPPWKPPPTPWCPAPSEREPHPSFPKKPSWWHSKPPAPASPGQTAFPKKTSSRWWHWKPRAPQLPQPAPPKSILINIRFSLFYPEKIGLRDVAKIIAYGHLESLAKQVYEDASERLGLPKYIIMKAKSRESARPLPKESIIQVSTDIPGLIFDRTEAQMPLWEDMQSVEFRFRAHQSYVGHACQGRVYFWLGGFILADIPVTIFVAEEDLPDIFPMEHTNISPYRKIFPSYSHRDTMIVEMMENYAHAYEDIYLRDVNHLRAGQIWQEELLDFIKKADIFQLFWSKNAAVSEYVTREWQHGLQERITRPDPFFIRPVYWSKTPR